MMAKLENVAEEIDLVHHHARVVKKAERDMQQISEAISSDDDKDADKQLVKQYTETSQRIFGVPNASEAVRLVQQRYKLIQRTDIQGDPIREKHRSKLLAFYHPFISGNQVRIAQDSNNDVHLKLSQVSTEISEYLHSKYGDLFIDIDDSRVYDSREIAAAMKRAVKYLHIDDEFWKNWNVLVRNQAHLSVLAQDPQNLQIIVGEDRPSMDGRSLKGLIGHELLWHGVRATNGWKTGDPLMGSGFPGYEAFEEGGGVMIEAVLTGEVPRKCIDRYIDISLATGQVGGVAHTREELVDLSSSRNYLFSTKPISYSHARKMALIHIGRIFRLLSKKQAQYGVSTRGISYYKGVSQVLDEYMRLRALGQSPETIMEYFEAGKFVQDDPLHQKYVSNQHDIDI